MEPRTSSIWSLPSVLALILASAARPAWGQETGSTPRFEPLDGVSAEEAVAIVLEGFVHAPDGVPAEGALVVSSAGGQARTDVAGRFRLEVRAPLAAQSLQVTAVGRAGANLAASRRVKLRAASPNVWVGGLELVHGSTCSPSWLPTFGETPGTNDAVRAVTVFDDGGGPALYVAGEFSRAGRVTANCIAKWDGSGWAEVGGGVGGANPGINALAVYDDGSGPALYAGGGFATAGGAPAGNLARWDGSSWTALGSGTNNSVVALAVYDDGGGPALFAGGTFTTAGGVVANGIARWDGASWSVLPANRRPNGPVLVLTAFDDGGGSALYAGGSFTAVGLLAANRIAKWNGSSWTALGSGVMGFGSVSVSALAVHDDGSGPALHVGGAFTNAGGVAANRIAKWDGAGWSALSSGLDGVPRVLAVHDDGGGAQLYVGGSFSSAGGVTATGLARWDGSSWTAVGGSKGTVSALATFDDGGGPALCVGGTFTTVGGVVANRIAVWDGAGWTALGGSVGASVGTMLAHDDGAGPALYARGLFTTPDGVATFAKWDGTSWTSVGGTGATVIDLALHDDGGGAAMHAIGSFSTAPGHVAKWNGSSWAPLGSGLSLSIFSNLRTLAVYDDGLGAALYVGGFQFTWAGGGGSIARWDGSSWSDLGGGTDDSVLALAVYDDGGGPALFAGGNFTTAGGVPAHRMAKWDGTSWSALGSGLATDGESPSVYALAVYDDGGGPALYAGGRFTTAGGIPANHIAKWDGVAWSALGSGISGGDFLSVHALRVHDDGSGPALYVGGRFTSAGGLAASQIARWDGQTWTALGSGVTTANLSSVDALEVYDDGSGASLFAAGSFALAPDSGDGFLARWGCADVMAPELECPSSVTAVAPIGSASEVVTFSVTAIDDLDPSPVGVCVPPSGSSFALGTTLVTCTATDASGNQSTCQFPVVVGSRPREL